MPTIIDNCDVTVEQIQKRQESLNARDSSLDGLFKKGGKLKWTTHTFPNGKTQTFLEMVDADGKSLRPLASRKTAGSLWLGLPLTTVTLARMTPASAGHFVDLDKRQGRYRYCLGFQRTDDDLFDETRFGAYKRAIEALNDAYNVDLPAHFALGKNSEGIPVTACVPQVKEKWEDFKERWISAAKKAASRTAMQAAKEKKLSKEDIKKAGEKAAKKVEFDEATAREDFRDELIEKMSDTDNKFLRAKNFSIINAEVNVINFDMRNNTKIKREISEKDRKTMDGLRKLFADNADETAHLDLIKEQLEKSFDSANPLKLNDEFIINDSEGTPMSMIDVQQQTEWRGALVSATIKLRAIDFKKIESIQVMTPVDLASVQVEVNGKRGSVQSTGSAVGFFGSPKRSNEEEAEAPVVKRIKSEPTLEPSE